MNLLTQHVAQSLSCIVSETVTYLSKIAKFNLPHLYLTPPLWWPVRILPRSFASESMGYRMALFAWSRV